MRRRSRTCGEYNPQSNRERCEESICKLDAKVLSDCEHDTLPVDGELQLGRVFTPGHGAPVKGLTGPGRDRQFR